MKILIAIPLLLIAYGLLVTASWIGEMLDRKFERRSKP